MQFSLPASNGYTLAVRTEGSAAAVSLWRDDGEMRVGSTYFLEGAVGIDAIDADLGPLGALHLRFVPSGMTRTVHLERGRIPPGCRAPRQLRRSLGSFEGTISFHGENGFAAVEATGARGSVGPSPRRRCEVEATPLRRVGAPRLPNVEHVWLVSDAFLFARDPASRGERSMTWFRAWTTGSGVRYAVDRFESLPSGLIAKRSVSVAGPASGFSYRGDLTGARLEPPAPFSGEATYSKRRQLLSGDLAVELPGIEPQSLTGPRFDARISIPR